MTELKKISSEIESIEQRLELISITETKEIEGTFQELLTIQTQLEIDLLSKIDKFNKKLTQVDPVTNAPRFGENTRLKVISLVETYQRQSSLCHALVDRYRTLAENESNTQKQQRQSDDTKELMHEHSSPIEAKENSKSLEEDRRYIEEQMKLKEEQEQETKKKLHEEAEKIRAKKKQVEFVPQNATVQKTVELGIRGIEVGIEQLRNSTQNLTAYKLALRTILMLLNNVIQHPENIMFRTIKLTNPKFSESVGCFQGGVECMLAAGFQTTKQDDFRCLILNEPDIIVDTQAWNEWFQNLKDCSERIKQEIDNRDLQQYFP